MEDLKIKDDLIYLDEKRIGFLEYSPDYSSFRNIEIDEEYRGKGYGKEAFRIWFENAKEETDKIECTAVISNKMESILNSFNFYLDENGRYIWKSENAKT